MAAVLHALGRHLPGVLIDDEHAQELERGIARLHTVTAGGTSRAGAARVYGDEAHDSLTSMVRFDWDALDAWFEEDAQIFVHPRNPYARVGRAAFHCPCGDTVGGVVVAETRAPIMLFETGIPTRYYFDRADVDMTRLIPTDTESECPYKGRTTQYWSIRTDGDVVEAEKAVLIAIAQVVDKYGVATTPAVSRFAGRHRFTLAWRVSH